MGNLSASEIVILLLIALLVFGGKGLPEAGRSIGKGLREFRRVCFFGLYQPEQLPEP